MHLPLVFLLGFFIMKICILTGTRPDIIKMAPLYWEAKKRGHNPVLVHTSQHFPYHLFQGVYEDLELPFPPHFLVEYGVVKKVGVTASKLSYALDEKFKLGLSKKLEDVASKVISRRPNPAATVSKIMMGLNGLFQTKLKDADIVLTHGDTLTSLSAALTAHLNLIPVGHIEAGLRTFSREPFPEQTCTRVSDACADLYFAATETNAKNLLNEGFSKERIFTVGNTVVDAALFAARKGENRQEFFEKMGVDFSNKLVYFSCHRRENLLHEERFKAIVRAMEKLSENGFQILWSVRPGTQEAISQFKLKEEIAKFKNIISVSEIPNYSDIMFLISRCSFVATDSGSMQEEVSALHIPCVTLRYITDRPESVQAGVNVLAKPSSEEHILSILEKVGSEKTNSEMRTRKNPYGDGKSSEKIIKTIEKFEGRLIRWEHQKK